jgi:hypothetical protein
MGFFSFVKIYFCNICGPPSHLLRRTFENHWSRLTRSMLLMVEVVLVVVVVIVVVILVGLVIYFTDLCIVHLTTLSATQIVSKG